MCTDPTRGEALTTQLLHRHPSRTQNFSRLKREAFIDWLLTHTDLHSGFTRSFRSREANHTPLYLLLSRH
jgi:hypothetical protein